MHIHIDTPQRCLAIIAVGRPGAKASRRPAKERGQGDQRLDDLGVDYAERIK